jgi:hypothetical protein
MPTSIGFTVPYSVDLATYDCNWMDRYLKEYVYILAMKVKFNYQQNKQSILIEHKKKIEKKKTYYWESCAFATA